jgi:hypothetical protein
MRQILIVARDVRTQAHLVHVESVEEVEEAMADLLRDKKVANATHNIGAYRIVAADGRLVRTPPIFIFLHNDLQLML